jgi:hypothetical protein
VLQHQLEFAIVSSFADKTTEIGPCSGSRLEDHPKQLPEKDFIVEVTSAGNLTDIDGVSAVFHVFFVLKIEHDRIHPKLSFRKIGMAIEQKSW